MIQTPALQIRSSYPRSRLRKGRWPASSKRTNFVAKLSISAEQSRPTTSCTPRASTKGSGAVLGHARGNCHRCLPGSAPRTSANDVVAFQGQFPAPQHLSRQSRRRSLPGSAPRTSATTLLPSGVRAPHLSNSLGGIRFQSAFRGVLPRASAKGSGAILGHALRKCLRC